MKGATTNIHFLPKFYLLSSSSYYYYYYFSLLKSFVFRCSLSFCPKLTLIPPHRHGINLRLSQLIGGNQSTSLPVYQSSLSKPVGQSVRRCSKPSYCGLVQLRYRSFFLLKASSSSSTSTSHSLTLTYIRNKFCWLTQEWAKMYYKARTVGINEPLARLSSILISIRHQLAPF